MNRYLDMVDHPSQIKKLPLEQLNQLGTEIREELITVLSKTGGHLGPNLGVVELTIALHRVFSTPQDKFVWDVSHQSYVHKLLTGRKDRFKTIRTTDGLNGFSLRSESEHDCYGAGHAGTALSAALGMCAARDQRKGGEHVVCIFGDAALPNGASFEALNTIPLADHPILVEAITPLKEFDRGQRPRSVGIPFERHGSRQFTGDQQAGSNRRHARIDIAGTQLFSSRDQWPTTAGGQFPLGGQGRHQPA